MAQLQASIRQLSSSELFELQTAAKKYTFEVLIELVHSELDHRLYKALPSNLEGVTSEEQRIQLASNLLDVIVPLYRSMRDSWGPSNFEEMAPGLSELCYNECDRHNRQLLDGVLSRLGGIKPCLEVFPAYPYFDQILNVCPELIIDLTRNELTHWPQGNNSVKYTALCEGCCASKIKGQIKILDYRCSGCGKEGQTVYAGLSMLELLLEVVEYPWWAACNGVREFLERIVEQGGW